MPAKKRKAPGGNRTGPKPKAGADAVVDATANNSPSKVGSAEAKTPPKVDFAPKVLPSVAANNRKLVDRVIKFQSVILNDPAFSDIETLAPLSLATASNQNADTTSFRVGYTNDAYTHNMTTHGKFECNYNLLHFDHMSSPTSMAATNISKVDLMVDRFFLNPTSDISLDEFPFNIGALVTKDQDPGMMLGGVKTYTPLEYIQTGIIGYGTLIENGATDEEKAQMRKAMLSVNTKFSYREGRDANQVEAMWSNHKVRDTTEKLGEYIKRTPIQRCLDVIESKNLLDFHLQVDLGAEKCAEYWKANMKDGAYNSGYIDAVFTVNRRLLSIPQTQELVITSDSEGDGVFESVYVLELIVKRGGKEDKIHWLAGGVLDLVKAKYATPGELSQRQLSGRNLPGGKGVLDLLLSKYDLLEAFISKAKDLQLCSSLVDCLEKWKRKGHMDYRQDCGYKAGDVNTQWKSAYKPHEQTFLQLTEEVCFTVLHDLAIKQQKLSGASMKDLLERSPLKEVLVGIVEASGAPASSATDSNTALGTTTEVNARDPDDGDAAAGGSRLELNSQPLENLTLALRPWVEFARSRFRKYCTYIVDAGSAEGIAGLMRKTAIPVVWENLQDGEYIWGSFDAKAAGHPSSRGHIRLCAFREEYASRTFKGIVKGLLPIESNEIKEMPEGVMFTYMDGFVHGNCARYFKCMTNESNRLLTKDMTHMYIHYRRGKADHKQKIKGTASNQTVEFFQAATATTLSVPERKRLHGAGDNHDDAFGPFEKPSRDHKHVVKVRHCDKATLFASAFVLVGGTAANDPGEADSPTPKGTEIVPMNYGTLDIKVIEEIDHAYNIKGMINATDCDGVMALHACYAMKTFVGITYSQEMLVKLENFCVTSLFNAFKTPGDKLFQPEMQAALKGDTTALPRLAALVGSAEPAAAAGGAGAAASGLGATTASGSGGAGGEPSTKRQKTATATIADAGAGGAASGARVDLMAKLSALDAA